MTARFTQVLPAGHEHVAELEARLAALHPEISRIDAWGGRLARVLEGGGRLLAAGNGGSASQAQHLTSELVGRYRDERRPLSALSLHADTSSLTAIVNDYGAREGFARQVGAHGRPGDALLCISTSGRSENLLAALDAAREAGLATWALTGPGPNPLAASACRALSLDAESTATVQELQQIVIHLLCGAVDDALAAPPARPRMAVVR
jgi:D-sedoheptulose 7-phosphate isomerase